jgi:hypothetical protein
MLFQKLVLQAGREIAWSRGRWRGLAWWQRSIRLSVKLLPSGSQLAVFTDIIDFATNEAPAAGDEACRVRSSAIPTAHGKDEFLTVKFNSQRT